MVFKYRLSKWSQKRGVFSDLKEAELEYLKLKTENIKSVAEKWKSQIDIRVYNALISIGVHGNEYLVY